MASSRASLDRSPRSNWVEETEKKTGKSLPPEVRARARALKKKNPSWSLSRCIAVAISQYKKEAAKGHAKGVKATAKWTALKAANKARMRNKNLTEQATNIANVLMFAQRAPGASGSNRPFDESKYVRNPGSGKFAEKYTPAELIAGRRIVEGGIANLQVGQVFKLPGDVGWVQRTAGGYLIQGPAGIRVVVREMSEAVAAAANLLAGKLRRVGEPVK